MFNHDAGEIQEDDGRRFIRTSRCYEGTALYGPYEVLPAGRYIAALEIGMAELAPLEADTVCAHVDVAAHYGATLYAVGNVTWRELRHGSALAVLQFDLHMPEQLEYRAWSAAQVSLLIAADWRITRIGDAPAPLDDVDTGFPDPLRLPRPTSFVQNATELRRLYERGVDYTVRVDSFDMSHSGRTVVGALQADINRGGGFFRLGSRIDISYAQMREDVILAQALSDVSRDVGFYVDVGANDPYFESVTRLFYERGWRGINIEPAPDWIARLNAARPRDVNLQAALSDQAGEVEFHDIDGGQLGTLSTEFANRHADAGMSRRTYKVPCMTLSDVCDQHVTGDIHFLKIDVEGFEGAVLKGMDFRRYRPWVLVVEATEPLVSHMLTHHDWDPLLRRSGYRFVLRDGVNRYYVAEERSALFDRFRTPPTGYIRAEDLG